MSITNKITVKRAEIAVAVILALCSIALMIKSAENRITWNAEENMGAGFLPFYLSLGMLICTVLTILKFVLKDHLNLKMTLLLLMQWLLNL